MYLITEFEFYTTIFEAYQTHRERTRYFYEKQFNPNIILDSCFTFADDTLAERLRRRPAKPMGSPRVGSNPTGVDLPAAPVMLRWAWAPLYTWDACEGEALAHHGAKASCLLS